MALTQYIPTYSELRKQGYTLEVAEHIVDGCWYLITTSDWKMRTESVEVAQMIIKYLREWSKGKAVKAYALRNRGKTVVCVRAEGE